MKKLLIALISLVLVVSCASGRYISMTNPQAEVAAVEILYQQHPELVNYYEQGVLRITSLREVSTASGADYRIKYRFVKRHYYDYTERMEILQEFYPEIYSLYLNGLIEITSLYKYVDEYGQIRHHVSYRRIYNYVYDYPYAYPYSGLRIYYRQRIIAPRPHVAPAPPRPRPNDNPPPSTRPNNRPRVEPRNDSGQRPPAEKPNNQPNSTPRNNVQPQSRPSSPSVTRPSTPSGSRSGGSTSRPSTPPSNNSGGGARRGR